MTPRPLPLILAILSAGAAAIHFAAMGEHFALAWTHGAFFAAVGWAQLVWSGAVLVRPSRTVALAGIAGNLLVVAVWAVSRTVGVPFGGPPEPVGVPDGLATGLELLLVCCALMLAERTEHAPLTRAKTALLALMSAGVAAAVGVSTLPAFAGHHHGTAEAAAGTPHEHDGAAPQSQAAPQGHQHGADPQAPPPTKGERAAADVLVAATKREVPKRWPTIDKAMKAGYEVAIDTGGVVHMTNMPWIIDDGELDPTRPESLVFYRKPQGGDILLGAMFIMPPGRPGPAVGGSLTHWHAHNDLCGATKGVVQIKADGTCPSGSTKMPMTPEMLHVWVVDYPDGPFGDATAPALRTAIGNLLAKGA
ncbi:hypothetical protein ACIBG8_34565 [Nonomuraea sp. NPDC050556]|uniref:hypothetical protein n=1 Tax=Nonomuraea sp. NPDC050556 TaxID=3364369 RepID=UPI00379CF5F7